jgi:hypothetical protein
MLRAVQAVLVGAVASRSGRDSYSIPLRRSARIDR